MILIASSKTVLDKAVTEISNVENSGIEVYAFIGNVPGKLPFIGNVPGKFP